MIKKTNLDLFLEELLTEADPIERPKSMADFAQTDDTPSSLDQAVDRYFVQYEREAIPTSEMYESNTHKLINFLFEQEGEEDLGALDLSGIGGDVGGDENATDDTVLGGGDLLGGASDDTASEKKSAQQPPVVNTPRINLQDFTRSIARLVNNAASLIDFRTIILNRAAAYIRNNYDEKTSREMMDILDKQWDLRPESTEVTTTQTPEYPESYTAVTGPVGG